MTRGCYPLFLLLARTGIRMGEAQAPQWTDIDFRSREIRVARALSAEGRDLEARIG
jgi:integrase